MNDPGLHKVSYRKPRSVDSSTSPDSHAQEERIFLQEPQKDDLPSSSLPTTPSCHDLNYRQLFAHAHTVASSQPRPERLETYFCMLSPDDKLHAPLAAMLAWMSKDAQEPALLQAGRLLYYRGLQEARAFVSESRTTLHDHTLATCLALIDYESLECPQENLAAYRWHRSGCARLVRLRGTAAHKDGLGHALFLAFRRHGILEALELQVPTFLADEEWREEPFALQKKSQYDRVFDLIAHAPRTLQMAAEVEAAVKSGNYDIASRSMLVQELHESCQGLRNGLLLLQSEFDGGDTGQGSWWSVPSGHSLDELNHGNTITSDLGPSLDSHIIFRDLETCRVLALLWAFLAMAQTGLGDIYQLSNMLDTTLLGSSDEPYPQRTNAPTWIEAIRRVCRSVHYCLNIPGRLAAGQSLIAGPLNVIIGTMSGRTGCETELAFAQMMREKIGTQSMRIVKYVDKAG